MISMYDMKDQHGFFYFATHLCIHPQDTSRPDAKLDLSSHTSCPLYFFSKLPSLTLKIASTVWLAALSRETQHIAAASTAWLNRGGSK